MIPLLALWSLAVLQVAPSERAPTSEPLLEDAWTSVVTEEIRAAEYRFSAVAGEPGTVSAPNRAQRLRSRIHARGVELFPRSTDASGVGAEWTLELGTRAFGREGDLRALDAGTPRVDGARVELERRALVEWFENRAEGVEQGWTIATRPSGIDPLLIVLEVGGLSLAIDEEGRSGRFVDGNGVERVAYRDLVAWDAAGQTLDARLVALPHGAAVRVDDRDARYPVTVDPLMTSPVWAAESDQAGARLGFPVAPAGDVNGDGFSDVAVGAITFDNGEADEGVVFVYHGSPSGPPTVPSWIGEVDQAGAFFGGSVGTAGDVDGDGYSDLVVGAYNHFGGQSGEGAAFVFLGSASGLQATPAWSAESDQLQAQFGWFVASAGDVNGDGFSDVIVGARRYDNGEVDEGAAFVYHGGAGGLSATPDWTAESDQAGAELGWAVACAGDVDQDGYDDVIVSAEAYDNGETDEGRVFVYHGGPAGLASSASWTAESDQANASFGRWVSTAGDVNCDGFSDVIVGAHEYDNGQTDEGRAFVYAGSPSGLGTTPLWTAEPDNASALFGNTVSTAGDVNGDGCSDVIVASVQPGGTGRAYVYLGAGSGLSATPAWSVASVQTNSSFGAAATAGDVNGDGYSDVIVGESGYDGGETDEGRAAIYLGSPGGLGTFPTSREADQADGRFGIEVASAGDVNGDGYSDVAVGADRFDGGEGDEGRVFVYHGSPSGPSFGANWTAESNQAGALFGQAVGGAGDVNGDGYDDLAVAAPRYDNGESNEGRAFVYHGSSSGLSATPAWTAEGDQVEARFGNAVAGAGDVNGDGFADLVVGAFQYDGGEADEGRAFVFHGSTGGLEATPAWTAEPDAPFSLFGADVSTAGDVNGDGYSDVIVGSPLYDAAKSQEGRVWVYHGSRDGLSATASWTAESIDFQANFGTSVSTAGDVNGDGYSDVIVGALFYDVAFPDEGGAFVYHGSATGLASSPAWSRTGGQDSAFLGRSVACAGDVNGDGYSDVIVGGDSFDNGEISEGRAWVHLGSATGLSTTAAWTAEANQAFASFGYSVAGAGDVNGDGYGDVIVGAYRYDGGQMNEGRAYVFQGGGELFSIRGAVVRALQQRSADGGRRLGLHARTDPSGRFRIACELSAELLGFAWATGVAPEAWLEWEIEPLGTPFDGLGVERGTAQPLTGGVTVFDEVAQLVEHDGLALAEREAVFRWRARVATNNPLFPSTAWFSVPGNAVTEAKLRKPSSRILPYE